MASWTAYQLSLWHEIAQWHGYSEFSMFSEEPSAYSVEDAYSNLLGISIANGLIYSALVFNDNQYARNFDTWFQATLKTLGAVSEKESRRYMRHVDGFWWDSTKRLPEKFIVLKRNYNMGHVQTPFLVPDSIKATFDIPAPCPAGSPPQPSHSNTPSTRGPYQTGSTSNSLLVNPTERHLHREQLSTPGRMPSHPMSSRPLPTRTSWKTSSA